MPKLHKNNIPPRDSVVFEKDFFDYPLELLFDNPHKLLTEGSLITLKIKIEPSKPLPLHLLDNQHQLITLASSYWTDEQYQISHLFGSHYYLEEAKEMDFLIHEIEVSAANASVFSADCCTYANDKLVAESSIICERKTTL